MRLLRLAVLITLSMPLAVMAKDKPKIIIEVVNSETSQRQYTYTAPGRKGTSETNCTTNGSTNGTISDYGVGPIQTHSNDNASTNCTTTTTAATPPQTHVRSITQEHVSAVLPDGRLVTLWCQEGFRKCDNLQPGKYEAEIEGNALFVFAHDLSGKEHKIKYKAVSIQQPTVAQQLLPEIESPAMVPPASPAQPPANSESAPSALNISTLKEQAISGDADAQWNLYIMYENGDGAPKDETQAMLWLRKAADNGYAPAQCELGAAYQLGQGVSLDYVQAASWFRKAAEQGNVDAQSFLGDLYEKGNGVPPDHAQAAIWYRKAAEQGDSDAQFSLGTLFYDGNGVPQNSAQAAIWYRKAAEQGNAAAQEELGGLYSFGRGVSQDETQAAIWYRKAAEQGDAKAQFMLGSDYFSGQGVPHNNAEACFWLDLADAGKVSRINPGDAAEAQDLAAKLRDDCALILTPADLSRVQERVRKWHEDHPAKP